MKIVIELPTWLGDCIMATPAIVNLTFGLKNTEIYFIGSNASLAVVDKHPLKKKTFLNQKDFISYWNLKKNIGKVDFFVSFRSSIRSKLLGYVINAKSSFQFNKNKFNSGHQVERYNSFINFSFGWENQPGPLKIFSKENTNFMRPVIGINPGASYGNAKRWYPEKFAKVASYFSDDYDILIFGNKDEIDVASEIEEYLISNNIKNYINYAGKTSLEELFILISGLSGFITGDSGPMHIAAAFNIPTVAIFGPTDDISTSQWKNNKSKKIKSKIPCRPCMKRECPLGHHDCMKKISSSQVIRELRKFFD